MWPSPVDINNYEALSREIGSRGRRRRGGGGGGCTVLFLLAALVIFAVVMLRSAYQSAP